MERNAQHAFDAAEVMAYLDGELEARRAAALAAHLVSCGECQEVAQGFRALSERMLSFEVERPAAGMNETVLAALDAGKSPKKTIPGGSEQSKPWNWRRMFARPYVWAFAGLGLVALLAVVSIPNFFRARPVAWIDTQRATGLSAPAADRRSFSATTFNPPAKPPAGRVARRGGTRQRHRRLGTTSN